MKTIFSLMIFLLLSSFHYGQEPDGKFELHSVSLAPNFYASNSSTGFMGNLDLTFNKNRHLFKASVMAAAEIDICFWGPCYTDNYYSYDLMYGREFIGKKGVALDVFAGVGYFHFKTSNPDPNNRGYMSKKTIGFPIQTRLRFRDGEIFNLGLQLHFNVNNASNIFAIGPFFQWNFNPRQQDGSIN